MLAFSVLALAPCLPPAALAIFGDWELDYDQIAQTGQQLFDQFATEEMKANYRPMTADELATATGSLMNALAGNNLGDLAALQPAARQTLQALQAHPATQGQADWLLARIDFFEMAAEAQRAIPSRAPPRSPPLPPHPASPLPPHPVPSPHPLPPHPQQPAPRTPATPPEPSAPPAQPTPAVESGRDRYAESKDVWLRKLANRPAPPRAAAMLPDLKQIFREEGVPPELVWQAEAESTFNPAARSPVGALGLYQFMPATAQEFGLSLSPDDERLDAHKNARAAARYLRRLHARFGSWPLALAAYNCGQGRLSKTLRETGGSTFADVQHKLPAETRMYVPKIAAIVQLRERVDIDRL
jgi:membrane-bound lytic murein transglycosylase D